MDKADEALKQTLPASDAPAFAAGNDRPRIPLQERRERQAVDGAAAMAEYKKAHRATLERMMELRAMRLAAPHAGMIEISRLENAFSRSPDAALFSGVIGGRGGPRRASNEAPFGADLDRRAPGFGGQDHMAIPQ